MRDDNNIRDIFNNSSLDDQDWLEPSTSVFQGIEEVIYPDEDDKLPAWLWVVLGLFLMISLSCIIYAVGFRDISDKNTTSSIQYPELPHTTDYSSINNTAQSTATADDQREINDVFIYEIDMVVSSKTASKLKSDVITNVASDNVELTATQIIESNTDYKKINTVPYDTDGFNIINNNVGSSIDEVVTKRSPSLKAMPVLESFNPELTVSKERLNIISDLSIPAETEINDGLIFNVGTGISLWNYNLNDNYLTALSPADFTHSSGHGRIVQVGIEKRNTSFISFRANLSYESVAFQSGHNSNILYRNADENLDHENNFNLDMATPLGGINSSISVRRNQDSTPNENTLSIALHNEHRYKNLDLTISSLQHLYESDLWNFNTEIGVGLNHTFDITNDLSAVDINDTAYSIASINESSTQMDLNLSRASILLGVNAGINLSKITAINFAYAHKRDLSTVFSSGDFNTTLTRHQFVLSMQTRF